MVLSREGSDALLIGKWGPGYPERNRGCLRLLSVKETLHGKDNGGMIGRRIGFAGRPTLA